MPRHIIDPTFFYQCIEQFSDDYDFYVQKSQDVDEYGDQKHTYEHSIITGSLQIQENRRVQRQEGNIVVVRYEFYCKSLYRINKGDFIVYQNQLLRVTGIHPYDEYGVRTASLEMVDFSDYTDLLDYIKYLEGEKLV